MESIAWGVYLFNVGLRYTYILYYLSMREIKLKFWVSIQVKEAKNFEVLLQEGEHLLEICYHMNKGIRIWFSREKWKKSSLNNEDAVNSLIIWCRYYWMWINKVTLPVFSVRAGSNCWLQYQLIFWKLVTFYGVNIA